MQNIGKININLSNTETSEAQLQGKKRKEQEKNSELINFFQLAIVLWVMPSKQYIKYAPNHF